jgi:NTP pyrophosphatase (non-canonical NTP hydrolase)
VRDLQRLTRENVYVSLREANLARDKEWLDKEGGEGFSALFHAVGMGGEAGEALNVVKKLERERLGYNGSRATVSQLAEELADMHIYADHLASKFGININHAIELKFNAFSMAQDFNTLLHLPDAATTPEAFEEPKSIYQSVRFGAWYFARQGYYIRCGDWSKHHEQWVIVARPGSEAETMCYLKCAVAGEFVPKPIASEYIRLPWLRARVKDGA